ncbi:hypothetical protein MPTK2_3g16300 [Marchantia polymorpha subsp. ruderalis]
MWTTFSQFPDHARQDCAKGLHSYCRPVQVMRVLTPTGLATCWKKMSTCLCRYNHSLATVGKR